MMTITINQSAIEQALRDWVSKQGIDTANKEIQVQLTAGRGRNGYSAEILIDNVSEGTADQPSEAKVDAKQPAEQAAKVEEDSQDAVEEKAKPFDESTLASASATDVEDMFGE